MKPVPRTRASFLIPYLEILHELGAPVERELDRSRLPAFIEEAPDNYVSLKLAFDFLTRCACREGIEDYGWLAASRIDTSLLGARFHTASQGANTVHERMKAFIRLVTIEDTSAYAGLIPLNATTRVFCDLRQSDDQDDIHFSEWIEMMVLIRIIQDSAGPDWRPDEMTFKGRFQPCAAALDCFGGTRIAFGQPHTSILVPSALLASRWRPFAGPCGIARKESEHHAGSTVGEALEEGFVPSLRAVVTPYLGSGKISLHDVAEMAGTSARSLQRILWNADTSFSEILEQARFEVAATALNDPHIKIIEIAYAVGYQDPSHFSRAFRKTSGLSPRDYRAAQRGQEMQLA